MVRFLFRLINSNIYPHEKLCEDVKQSAIIHKVTVTSSKNYCFILEITERGD